MSEERNYPTKEFVESELWQLLHTEVEALRGVNNISMRIEKLLDGAIAYYGADRAYVIEGDVELITGVNTYERCAPGVEPQRDTLKDMPPEGYVHWLEIFRKFEDVVIPDMEAIKDTYPGEYRYFHNSNVNSIIVVPFNKRINQGFVGVDNPKKHKEEPLPLIVLSYAVVLELNEIKLTKEKVALLHFGAPGAFGSGLPARSIFPPAFPPSAWHYRIARTWRQVYINCFRPITSSWKTCGGLPAHPW